MEGWQRQRWLKLPLRKPGAQRFQREQQQQQRSRQQLGSVARTGASLQHFLGPPIPNTNSLRRCRRTPTQPSRSSGRGPGTDPRGTQHCSARLRTCKQQSKAAAPSLHKLLVHSRPFIEKERERQNKKHSPPPPPPPPLKRSHRPFDGLVGWLGGWPDHEPCIRRLQIKQSSSIDVLC